jgi:5,10-methylene-tetrahydrofolate dehydrogenase/methenyl tetrahydrofolate cyclohydrolase
MSAHIVEGKSIAEGVYVELKREIPKLMHQTGQRPVLVSVYTSSNPAIEVYIRSRHRIARALGTE